MDALTNERAADERAADESYDVVVVGKGLMGSAAFRYCCEHGVSTLLIGPDEPPAPETHDGVFGAHYDQSRLTHLHGKSDVWSELGRRSIGQYRNIEAASGISFYEPVGELFVADDGVPSHYSVSASIENSRDVLGVDLSEVGDDERRKSFPYLSFPEDASVVWEKRPAGYINPRALLQAQLKISESLGGAVLATEVTGIDVESDGVRITTSAGNHIRADRVLVAAGSFSNTPGLLPESLPLILKTEMIVLGRVPQSEVDRLAPMPVIHYEVADDTLANLYMVPPVQYPDGHFYIKMGANTVADQYFDTKAEMCHWYARGDSDEMLNALRETVLRIVPGLEASDWHTSRCVIARTPSTVPIVKTMVPDRLFVAAGGNGSSAYCSDAIGQLAANLTVTGIWSDPLSANVFEGI